jgi:hypothetical protein
LTALFPGDADLARRPSDRCRWAPRNNTTRIKASWGTKRSETKRWSELNNNERVFKKYRIEGRTYPCDCLGLRSDLELFLFAYRGATLPRKSNVKWSDEEDKPLLALRAAGKSAIS